MKHSEKPNSNVKRNVNELPNKKKLDVKNKSSELTQRELLVREPQPQKKRDETLRNRLAKRGVLKLPERLSSNVIRVLLLIQITTRLKLVNLVHPKG